MHRGWLAASLVVLAIVLAACGSRKASWSDVRLISTESNPGQGPCYSAINPDRTVKRIICQGNPGVGTCYMPGYGQLITFDDTCVAAREAIEKAQNFKF